ncbi:retrovirus-related Pol polyprotein from transposon 412 [Trichonephila clavipes]|nr:retrovirus-related Pol polyprotein from transposon 412 [Trichonephila clavipes]
MQMTLADGRTQTTEILTTSVDISIQGKVIPTELLILKNARGNRTLLGIDFLTAAGIVLDLQRKQWYFTETSHRKYNFVKPPPNIDALLTVDPEPHLCQLRKNEGTHFSLPQREEINSLLEKYEECFQPGGEPTPFIEHRINTRNHLPVAVPPYRMNPSKKEILKQEIDRLLSEGIIEECESPYASPVVLIPKPNGTFRLCIDYRKLNEITVADTYPLPRMDDLLHQAKLTPFMSTLDLRAGYHQVKVHAEEQDKQDREAQEAAKRAAEIAAIERAAKEAIKKEAAAKRAGVKKDQDVEMNDASDEGHKNESKEEKGEDATEEGTFQKIARRNYWTGMRKYISDYIKKCPECARFKATNQKPAGLLRTPVYSQRFEVIAIDLFGPLPQTDTGKQWIFIVEDCATKWVELFALSQASARQCATTLIEEVFMRHGIPRRIISDNGMQFVSAVLQQICFTLNISQNFIPVYSSQSNPVERKNRDLKPRLAILVGDDHSSWYSKLPVIRFALNTTVCDTTGHTPAYLLFGRELRTVDDVVQDFKSVVHNDNFVAEITPYLKRFATITEDIRERIETKQDQRKKQYDKNRRPVYYSPGDKVWVTLHPISCAKNKKTSKFMPKRDGPYLILTQKSPTSYVIASLANPSEPILLLTILLL